MYFLLLIVCLIHVIIMLQAPIVFSQLQMFLQCNSVLNTSATSHCVSLFNSLRNLLVIHL